MKNTPEVQRALLSLIEEKMTRAEIAESVGVAASTVGDWTAGLIKDIRPANWQKLLPLVAPYLAIEFQRPPHVVSPVNEGDVGVAVPVVGIAQAANFEAALQSLDEFVTESAEEMRISFPLSREGDVAVRVEGESMLPWYPAGTILLARPTELPQRGDIVVAKLGTGAVVAKRYQRRQNVVTLEALNHGDAGETFEWHVKERPGFVLWMWPVIQSIRDERNIRWQAAKMGKQD